ncbi:hypothetical protein QQM39_00215 [Streptomyces sp. DT2A-34]|nr:hypothetical protein [Streptomyces sp. DT2A-34]MDO0909347.1 hypothetical protein [Streptomyces sp. DT2A-34]
MAAQQQSVDKARAARGEDDANLPELPATATKATARKTARKSPAKKAP